MTISKLRFSIILRVYKKCYFNLEYQSFKEGNQKETTGSTTGYHQWIIRCNFLRFSTPKDQQVMTYHIWSLIFLPSSSIVRILKSIPKKHKNEYYLKTQAVLETLRETGTEGQISRNPFREESRMSNNPPIVEMNVELNASSEKRNSTQVLPTPESPIKSSLKRKS